MITNTKQAGHLWTSTAVSNSFENEVNNQIKRKKKQITEIHTPSQSRKTKSCKAKKYIVEYVHCTSIDGDETFIAQWSQ